MRAGDIRVRLRGLEHVNTGKLEAIGGGFERIRQSLLARYRCPRCKGGRQELATGITGIHYRRCRHCDGRGHTTKEEEQHGTQVDR